MKWVALKAIGLCLVTQVAAPQPSGALEPGRPHRFSDCQTCPTVVVIPAGQFQLGTQPGGYEAVENTGEMPAVNITVPRAFAIGVTEVTRTQFSAFITQSDYEPGGDCRVWFEGRWTRGTAAGWLSPKQPDKPEGGHPANCVSWEDAQAYVSWLSEKTGREYALPSEAQWEYAARGGVTAPRWWGWNSFEGVSISDACEHANVFDIKAMRAYPFPWPHARCSDGFADVAPTGSYDPNPFGLFDVVGNLWEWTADCYTGSYVNRPPDSRAWVWQGGCETRSVRGGAWSSRPLRSRSSNRSQQRADYRSSDLGFRVVRALPVTQ